MGTRGTTTGSSSGRLLGFAKETIELVDLGVECMESVSREVLLLVVAEKLLEARESDIGLLAVVLAEAKDVALKVGQGREVGVLGTNKEASSVRNLGSTATSVERDTHHSADALALQHGLGLLPVSCRVQEADNVEKAQDVLQLAHSLLRRRRVRLKGGR